MKNKTMSLILAIVSLFTFSACNNDLGSTPKHDVCTYGEWQTVKNPTCTATGSKKRVCSVCGDEETEIIAMIQHNYKESITRAATCTRNGEKTFVCTQCSASYTESYSLEKYTAEEIYAQAKDCAVEIITYDHSGNGLSLGSGFVYTANGQIVTNYHVIEEACSADVYVGETRYSVQTVLAYDIDRDLAILQIEANNLSILPVCDKGLTTGSTVYALGSSRGLTSTFSRGIITAATREIDGVIYVQHDAAISSGNSGGPLINEFGEIIGVNTLTMKDSQNLNFAIFVSELKELTFGTPMTLREVYEKECDAFAKVKNYVISKGKLDSDGDEYTIETSKNYASNGTLFKVNIFYKPSTDIITLAILWDNELFLTIELDEVYYSYDYGLLWSEYSYYMFGTLYANTFSASSTYLTYSSTNAPSSLRYDLCELSASLAKLLITTVQKDLASINVTAVDLGFLNF